MNDHGRFPNQDEENADVKVRRQDTDEGTFDESNLPEGRSDVEPGPDDDDGLPDNARRRVPS
jgi:hypothetical protein